MILKWLQKATLIDMSLLPQQQNSIATSATMDCCCLKGSVIKYIKSSKICKDYLGRGDTVFLKNR